MARGGVSLGQRLQGHRVESSPTFGNLKLPIPALGEQPKPKGPPSLHQPQTCLKGPPLPASCPHHWVKGPASYLEAPGDVTGPHPADSQPHNLLSGIQGQGPTIHKEPPQLVHTADPWEGERSIQPSSSPLPSLPVARTTLLGEGLPLQPAFPP